FFIALTAPCALADNIHVQEVERLGWGTVGIPPSGSASIAISPGSGATSGSGKIIYGTPSRGKYLIRLSGGGHGGHFSQNTISLDIDDVRTGSRHFSIQNFKGIYGSYLIPSFPSPTLPSPAQGQGSPLYLGATLTVDQAVREGDYSPSFDIIAFIN
ncbi:MAG TPA: DUF4402 domain-containing protein, partial [Alphaproteobacteria bacterium]|nr:DUF4402 domain-containing protein [Alphaproteobacteria bacterium]